MDFYIPEEIHSAMKLMTKKGFTPYLVGGCVRDIIMGRIPHDYDITVNALPDEIASLFGNEGYKTIAKGHKFGTVGVYINNEMIEITPHRTEGEYNDARHPDKVQFVKDITLDLSRRDFTVNAIAMDISGNIVDIFGGCDDIKKGIIKCVGDPMVRFGEDSLRILRAMRFASRFGFSIDEATRIAMVRHSDLVTLISAERTGSELLETLSYPHFYFISGECIDVIRKIIPCFIPHEYLLSASDDVISKLYSCICTGSGREVSDVCSSLKLKSSESDKIRNMHELYSKILTRDGEKVIFDDKTRMALCDFKRDHVLSVFDFSGSANDEFCNFLQNGIYTNTDLAVSGGDIISCGLFPKEMTSRVLHAILYEVACGRLNNNKDDILNYLFTPDLEISE